jgi:hypothetical protein
LNFAALFPSLVIHALQITQLSPPRSQTSRELASLSFREIPENSFCLFSLPSESEFYAFFGTAAQKQTRVNILMARNLHFGNFFHFFLLLIYIFLSAEMIRQRFQRETMTSD